ncbi:Ig-like domain-containing protein [Brevibacillus reuszeri]|uniref:Ig-like domain-containing protein n=1 Tax=Brevibacillus reuszeri TaxID=54915 RepID=UPI0035E3E448
MGLTVPYDASLHFKDQDNDPLTYSIAINDSSFAQVSVNSSTGLVTITPLKIGDATVTITVSDGISGPVSTSFTLSVR